MKIPLCWTKGAIRVPVPKPLKYCDYISRKAPSATTCKQSRHLARNLHPNGLIKPPQVLLGEDLVREVAQLHARIFKRRLFAFVQGVHHDELCRTRFPAEGLELVVPAALEQPVRKRIELGL